ncbi:MAG: radical SAM protein [Thermodesulfobacteriota bacterium]|nr:radical SAM protein [Thermodesulfobacteriota bacterium]
MKPIHPDKQPSLVFANRRGEIKDFPGLTMAGRSGHWFFKPQLTEMIPLPEGSDLFVLPDRLPIGIDPETGDPVLLDNSPDDAREGIQAVAAFMAPAHTAIYTAAFEKIRPEPIPLPLFAYTAVGWYQDQFWVCGFRSDNDPRQDFAGFNPQLLREKTVKKLNKFPRNRLIQHLGKCCLTYGCPAAKNFFLNRFEAPLPTSPACNAKCVGCISLQASGCCPSTQDRIRFVPSPGEIAEIAVPHLNQVKGGVVSFGQGCEGEPLLQAETLEKGIRLIRKQTDCGTINLNSNASLPAAVERLAAAGLDSIRVSINSSRKGCHTLYYRPKDFSFKNVLESILVMKKAGRFVSLNYFILPGFTDDPDEFQALCDLINLYRPDLIQLRNLNMDPDWYLETVQYRPKQKPMGMQNWLSKLKNLFPDLRFGYFNPALRD